MLSTELASVYIICYMKQSVLKVWVDSHGPDGVQAMIFKVGRHAATSWANAAWKAIDSQEN